MSKLQRDFYSSPMSSKDERVRMRWSLQGDRGVVQFAMEASWTGNRAPVAVDLGYHSPIPKYRGQSLIAEQCPFLGNRPCYYDGSTLAAEKPMRLLLEKGSNALWKFLEEYYEQVFNTSSDRGEE